MKQVENIDVMKMKKELEDSIKLSKFAIRPSTISNVISFTTLQTMSVFTHNIVLDAIFFILGGYNIARVVNNWSAYKNVDYRLSVELEKTDVYRRLCEHYFTFVHEVAKFAKQFNLKSTKEVILFFELMMENGYFSETGNHAYRKFKHVYTEMDGTTGAQVMTGECVCRHMSSIFCDLLHQMNMTGCNVVVKINHDDEVKKFLRFGKKKVYNHAVVGVVEDDMKYIYDPTHGTFAGKCETKFKGHGKDEVAFGTVKGKDSYYFPSHELCSLNKLHLDKYREYVKASMGEIDPFEIEKLRIEANIRYIQNYDMFEKFYFEFVTLLQEIADDVRQLMPKSDEEIKEWVLKY